VLALEDPNSGAREKLSREIKEAIKVDRAEAIVLGCAGMAELAASLSREHGLPVDGVAAAVRLGISRSL
jgi:allantoin racemase